MRSLSDLIHKTPWWALVGGGLALFAVLVVYVTPFQLLRLEKSGASVAENRAIKREIDFAFSEGAIDVARRIVKEMKAHTKDPALRADLERTLTEIDEARTQVREAGREVARAKREAAQTVNEAVRDATARIVEAQRDAARALREAGVDDEKVTKSLEETVRAAKEAEVEARRAAKERADERVQEAQRHADEARQRLEEKKRHIQLGRDATGKPALRIDLGDGRTAEPGAVEVVPLPPELRDEIRRKVSHDVYKIGIGAGLILLFIPLFILTVVAKFFIDRSRAAQQVADFKRKEADYHRMSQQLTEAKLQALQAQVEPHFLYNTLASVQALTEVDPDRASTLTGHLIQYLRNALPKMRESISTVQQEIELVRAYLNILQVRMGERLSFEIDVPPHLANAPFPPLMLPSLVENAIKHGLEPQREGGKVTIRAEEHEGRLRLSVTDTGRGFAETLGSGVGLSNIRERLAALYGDKGKLTLEASQPAGVVATIEVPRDGARVPGGLGAVAGDAKPEPPKGAAAKTLAAMGAAERMWRKGLSFTFMALVVVAAVLCGLALVGILTGIVPVEIGDSAVSGPPGLLIGTAGVLLAFIVIVIVLAIVIAIFYGLGFLFAGIAIFIPLAILVALVPALAPFILVGLFVWWLVRRHERKRAAKAAALESAHADGDPR